MYGEHLLRNLENLGLCRQYSKTTDYKEQDGQCEEENVLQETMSHIQESQGREAPCGTEESQWEDLKYQSKQS